MYIYYTRFLISVKSAGRNSPGTPGISIRLRVYLHEKVANISRYVLQKYTNPIQIVGIRAEIGRVKSPGEFRKVLT
jgi:hypothetical protein